MELYEEESGKPRVVQGITDKVSVSVQGEINYPVVYVMLDESTPKHKLQALSKLLKTGLKREVDTSHEDDNFIHVALKTDTVCKPVGKVVPSQVKTLMAILIGLKVELELEKGKMLDAKYIYALST